MVQNEPRIFARTSRRQGIAALYFSDDAADFEGANPLAPLPAAQQGCFALPNILRSGCSRESRFAGPTRV